MSKHSNLLSGKVESNLNFSPNYVVLRQDLNIIIWIKERFSVFQSGCREQGKGGLRWSYIMFISSSWSSDWKLIIKPFNFPVLETRAED